jgi:hypothetical protein
MTTVVEGISLPTLLALYGGFAAISAALWKLLKPFRHRMQVEDAQANAAAWKALLTDGAGALLADECGDIKELKRMQVEHDLAFKLLQRVVEAQGVAILTLPDIRSALDRNNIVLSALAVDFGDVKRQVTSTRTLVSDIMGVMRGNGSWGGEERRREIRREGDETL